MAIEDDDIHDREVWTAVSRYWYSKASDKAPTTGRLYHHLAILARPNALHQLFYYAKTLCVPIPLPFDLSDKLTTKTKCRTSHCSGGFGHVYNEDVITYLDAIGAGLRLAFRQER